MSRRSSRSVALLAVIVAVAGSLVVAPSAAASYPDDTVHFDGRGWGHGRGLGQWGSYGYAVDHGWDHRRILDHFYGGTTSGSRPDGPIDVKLVFLDGTTAAPTDMVVTSAAAFTIGENAYAAGEWGRVRWNGAGWTIERSGACGGPWAEAQKLANADLQPVAATTADPGDDFTRMVNVLQPDATKACTSWNKRAYRGTLRIARLDTQFTRVLNRVPMEQYLRGVVPRESPASWGSAGGGTGIEALKAQAVAARSYAWAENRSAHYKTCDTTSCQVYGGAGLNGLRSEHPNTDRAVAETAGEVRLKGSTVVRTEFSSSTGGYTAGGEFPAVVDDGDDTPNNPNHTWTDSISVAAVEARFPLIGELSAIRVTERTGLGPMGGWVRKVAVVGSEGTVTRTGEQARSDFGLLSGFFTVVDVVIDTPRLEGPTRFETAVAVSKDLYPTAGSAQAAVLASAATYADAVVGAPLAGARGGPILLTDRDGVPAATMDELQRVLGPGGKTVYVLGGEAAVSATVPTQLEAAGFAVQRYGGATRFATAVQVAEALGNPGTVLVATGTDFADALAAGAAAIKAGGSVLLSQGNQQAPETSAYLQAHPPSQFFAVGGAAAAAHRAATPVVGPDRYETAVEVANRFFPGPVQAGLASGTRYFDALSGGVHAAARGGPLVLTQPTTLPPRPKTYLQSNAGTTLERLYVYGGSSAISDDVLTQLRTR